MGKEWMEFPLGFSKFPEKELFYSQILEFFKKRKR